MVPMVVAPAAAIPMVVIPTIVVPIGITPVAGTHPTPALTHPPHRCPTVPLCNGPCLFPYIDVPVSMVLFN